MLPEFKHLFNEATNFFKHADRDTEGIHTFNPRQTEFILFDACHKLHELTGELVPSLGVYQLWFRLGPGADFFDTTREKGIQSARKAFAGATRASFFQQMLPVASSFR